MKKTGKRLGALLLALVMIVSLVPMSALAARVEDDAVEIAAPETAVHEAKPAGAVDAEDVPAVLAEGETNLALKEPPEEGQPVEGVYASGIEAPNALERAVDDSTNTHWGSSKMKNGGQDVETAQGAVSWFVVDLLGDDNTTIAVDHITSISMVFNLKVWPTACKVQVATGKNVSYDDYTTPNSTDMKTTDSYTGTIHAIDNENWITVAEFAKASSDDNNNVTMSTAATETTALSIAPKENSLHMDAIPEGVRYVRVYFTGINARAAGACIGMKELQVMGTTREIPPYTEENIDAGLFDVGAHPTKNAEGVWSANYSNPDNSVVTATAPSQRNGNAGDDGPASFTVDGNTGSWWHTNWQSGDSGTLGPADLSELPEQRYLQLTLATPTEISGLRYLPRNWDSNDWVNSGRNGHVVQYEIKVCTDDEITADSVWTTVASSGDGLNQEWVANNNPAVFQLAQFKTPVTAKFVRLYGTRTVGSSASGDPDANVNKFMSAVEVRLVKNGALPNPTATEYLRKTGEIEEGIYVIYDPTGNRILHNSGTATNQCEPQANPNDDQAKIDDNRVVQLGHANDSFVAEDHLWKIAAVDSGYSIQGVTAARAKYLTATASGTQLELGTTAVAFTITPSGDEYKVSPASDSTKYLQYNSDWKLSGERTLRLYKETVTELSETSITGRVTDGNGEGLVGATVTLATSNHYAAVAGVTATTGENGAYTIDTSGLGNGTYYVRASMDGRGAKINTATPVMVKSRKVADVDVDVDLPAIDTTDAKFVYTMEANVEGQPATRPTLEFAKSGTVPTSNYGQESDPNPALTLSFTSSDRMTNLVKLTGTGVKNGTIEFDATRTGTYSSDGRFGLALRLETNSKWIFIGSENSDSSWFHERWDGGASHNNGWSTPVSGPIFGKGDTRHFKVTIQGENISLSIDGIDVITNQHIGGNGVTGIPANAADVGFICGNNGAGVPSTVTIDNLYIFREDPTFTVTLGSGLTAQISDSAGDTALGGDSHNQASAGDKIKITATGLTDGQVLDAVTVTGAGNAAVATEFHEAEGENPAYFIFIMPESAVSVSGTVRTVVGDVTISEANGLKEGKTLTANVAGLDEANADKVSYQWYHQANENQSAAVDATEDGWIACTNEGNNTKTKTISAEDVGKKVKVVVTGKTGNDTYATTVSKEAVSSGVMVAADVPVTGVSFDSNSLTMWSNLTVAPEGGDLGNTATLTATVTPEEASPAPTYAWSVVDENGNAVTGDDVGVITLATDATETNTKQITANKAGKVWVKVTVTGGEKADGTTSTASATIPVTVKTGITSITLTKGGDTLTSSSELTIYANDSEKLDSGKVNSVTVTAAVNSGALAADLLWSCGHDEEGYPHIFQLGGADDAGSAEGASVVISAYNDHELVGEETVTVSAPTGTGNTADAVTFKVKVVHKLDTTEHSVSIGGTPKLGVPLSVNLTNVPSTVSSDKLDYAWKRTKNGTEASVGSEATYTPTGADDAGATFTVTVTAKTGSYYEGSLTSIATAAVEKLDAPSAPTLSPTKPSAAGESDGYITITDYNSENEYTYQIKIGTGNWADATVTSEGKITGLAAGAYSVKVKETDTRKESAAATTNIAPGDAVEYTITVTQPTEGAIISVSDKSAANVTVTITLTVTAGWQVDAVKVNGSTDGVTAGENNTWTFTMPAGEVTVTAEVSKKTVKITHNLTNLTCDITTHDADGNHVVNYGEVASITLTAVDGFNLPSTVKVTKAGSDGNLVDTDDAVSYNNGVITFTGGVTQDITITASATAKTFIASFDPATSGNLAREVTSTTPIAYDGTLTATLTPDEGYSAPAKENVEVTMGGTAANFEYSVDATSGVATVTVANVKGNVVIKAISAVKDTTEVTAVTIGVGHNDSSATGDVPHVGDLLTATVTPPGATVTFQWYAGETAISGATQATYRIASTDLGKTIKVKVTGTGDYSGEVTSAATPAVENFVKLPTGISLDQTAATVEFGKTLTLTATVVPADATDKTVTWTSSNAAVATVEGGVVTATGAGTATITATDTAGHNATCAVTVDPAQVGVTLSGMPKVGQTLTATITPEGATARIYWYRVGAGQGGSNVSIANNDQTTYTLVSADAGYKIMVSIEATGGNYTGTASTTTENPIAGENEDLPAYAITVAATTNGTVTADKEEASEGDTVTLTVTPATGYKLDALTVTKADSSEVTVAEDNTFTMPGEAVTVTATFAVDASALDKAIADAKAAKDGVQTKDEDTDPSTVSKGTKYVTEADMTALNNAIAAAEAVKNNAEATEAEITSAVSTLMGATDTFKAAIKTGTKQSSSRPSSSTSTVTNPDGSTTTTTTKPDGTKVETTEKPDGTKETVETKRDGTVIETVETPDGTVESVKTQPDGTVVETVVAPDGTKESVATKPDGTVTETVIDAEGAMTEKVTDPEENVVITVTDPEGEELAKVEIPAEIPEPETKFEDAVDHWAEESINKVAALGLMNGVGDNKYGTESSLTRGQLATVLYRLSNGKSGYHVSFSDVELGQYYTDGVAWAAKANVVTGYTTDIFAPEDTITREQLAVMLCRYAKLIGMDTTAKAESLNAFADGANTGAWAVDGMAWCVENGILKGKGADILDPTANVTRAQVAVMLDRFIELIK